MYLTLILFNSFATAVYLVLSSKVMKKSGLSPNATIAVVHLTAAAILALPGLFSRGSFLPIASILALVWLGVTSGLKLLSKELAFFAYSRTDVANVTVFSAFIPILGILFGWIMLKENVTRLELVGTFIICISVYLLFLRREPGATGLTRFLSPLVSIRSLPIFCGFLSTVPIALSSVYMKKSAQVIGSLHFAFYSTFLIGLSAASVEVMTAKGRGTDFKWMKGSVKELVLIGAVFASAQYSYVILITMERIAHTIAFQPLGIVFQMVLAYFVVKEREHPFKRLICGIGIVLGSILLELGRY